ncbi:MAG: type II toxin-antitoxin system HicA family toxin [Bacteroidales bacterium]|nr:type II toxin-antitoxin system HicA family toxin [Bacteroidales bacterium]
MKWSELRRIAERNGWYLVRTGSRHDIYAHPEKVESLRLNGMARRR